MFFRLLLLTCFVFVGACDSSNSELLKIMGESLDHKETDKAKDILVSRGETAIPFLVEVLKEHDTEKPHFFYKSDAAEVLGSIRPRSIKAIDPILDVFRKEYDGGKKYKDGDYIYWTYITALIKLDPNYKTFSLFTMNLEKVKRLDLFVPLSGLREVLSEKDFAETVNLSALRIGATSNEGRISAIKKLTKLFYEELEPTLLKIMEKVKKNIPEDPKNTTLKDTIICSGYIGSEKSVPAIKEHTKRKESHIKEAAKEALSRIKKRTSEKK